MAQPFPSVQAPTSTAWTSLYNLYWTLAVIAGAITVGALVYFAVKYRSKPGIPQASFHEDDSGGLRLVIIVIVVMGVILGSAAFASFNAIGLYTNPPNSANAIHVSVIASRFQWNFNYSDGRQVPGQLVVSENTVVILSITSVDVFHSFGIPSLRVKADAIPGKINTLWFSAPAGILRIQCYELCGTGHAFMIAKLNVCQGTCA
jgi:cytochrome c oxidase subunit 2